MKIFISWSGEPSRSIARALNAWLPPVVQHAETWVSDEEIKSGMRWSEVIGKSLDAKDFGIICVTRSNQHAPWLVFEAGALAKRLDVARVVPLCIDIAPSDVTGPLAEFQGRCLDKDGMRRLVHDVSEACASPIPAQSVDALFEAMWSSLEAPANEAVKKKMAVEKPQRSTDDMLAEIIDRVRRIERNMPAKSGSPPDTDAPPDALDFINKEALSLIYALRKHGVDDTDILRMCREQNVAELESFDDDFVITLLSAMRSPMQGAIFASAVAILNGQTR